MGKLTRRAFMVSGGLAGGGLLLGYAFTPNRLALRAPDTEERLWLTSWVSVNADNSSTILVPQAEMGQGVFTALPMMLAEEMEADWDLVEVKPAPAEGLYVTDDIAQGFTVGEAQAPKSLQRLWDYAFYKAANMKNLQLTGGSSSVRFTGQWGMRVAGAAAKEMLIRAAAARWGVASATLRAERSQVLHKGSGRQASFAELAPAAARYKPSLTPPLKDPRDYALRGASLQRLDLPDKVAGTLRYGVDLQLDNMKTAAIRHAPCFGGKTLSMKPDSVRDLPGVRDVLRLPNAVAVTADNYWRAQQAVSRLDAEFTDGGNGDFSSEQMFKELAAILDSGKAEVDFKQRDGAKPLSRTAPDKIVEAEYRAPFLAHATMEPMSCAARHHNGKLEVWAGVQDPLGTRALAARTAGLALEDVVFHPLQMGGGFGRRAAMFCGNFIEDAVRVAMQVPYPVKLIWSREEDMQHDYYRPAMLSRFQAALDDQGRPKAWVNRYTDIGVNDDVTAAFIPYSVEHQHISRTPFETPVPVSFWRSVEYSYQGFFIESFIDELAHRAGADPLAYRLKLLTRQKRHRALLHLAAEKIGWDDPLPDGAGLGLAIVKSFGSIVAQAVRVSLAQGDLRVEKVVSAVDPGALINPAIARAQIESGIIYGMTAALHGEIDIKQGRVAQSNFHDYPMVRLATAPRMETHFIESGAPIGGMGEVGTPPIAPALCNAIFAAGGPRLRRLPIAAQLSSPTA